MLPIFESFYVKVSDNLRLGLVKAQGFSVNATLSSAFMSLCFPSSSSQENIFLVQHTCYDIFITHYTWHWRNMIAKRVLSLIPINIIYILHSPYTHFLASIYRVSCTLLVAHKAFWASQFFNCNNVCGVGFLWHACDSISTGHNDLVLTIYSLNSFID